MQVAIDRLAPGGKYGMINMHSWMFLSSFEKLRKAVLEEQTIDSLLHLGPRTFDELSGEVVQNASFVITKTEPKDTSGTYFRLLNGIDCGDKERLFLDALINHTKGIYFVEIPQRNFKKIPGTPIGYWVSQSFIAMYDNDSIEDHYIVRNGISTGDNTKYLRLWFEVSNAAKYWKYCNKGGTFRKWYGNNDYIV